MSQYAKTCELHTSVSEPSSYQETLIKPNSMQPLPKIILICRPSTTHGNTLEL